jgi:hypothetical protein
MSLFKPTIHLGYPKLQDTRSFNPLVMPVIGVEIPLVQAAAVYKPKHMLPMKACSIPI